MSQIFHWVTIENHIFHIHEICQRDAKSQIISKEKNHYFPRLGVEALRFETRAIINGV